MHGARNIGVRRQKMWTKVILFLMLVKLKTVKPQYYNSMAQQFYQSLPQQFFEQPDLDTETMYADNGQYSTDPLDPNSYSHGLDSQAQFNSFPYNNADECTCSCNRCQKEIKPCCIFACFSCPKPTTESNNFLSSQNSGNSNSLVFVPYPYPLPMPNLPFSNLPVSNLHGTDLVQPSTTATTTTAKVKQTAKPFKISPAAEESFEDNLRAAHRNMKQINPAARRQTRPTWIPKYGIVPIPDHLALKLMSQLRGVRALQARKL